MSQIGSQKLYTKRTDLKNTFKEYELLLHARRVKTKNSISKNCEIDTHFFYSLERIQACRNILSFSAENFKA